jgi:hypothetical protein
VIVIIYFLFNILPKIFFLLIHFMLHPKILYMINTLYDLSYSQALIKKYMVVKVFYYIEYSNFNFLNLSVWSKYADTLEEHHVRGKKINK